MKRRQKHISASPLIDPTASSLVLIQPRENSAGHESAPERYEKHLSAIAAAANIVDVPVFLLCPETDKPKPSGQPIPFAHRLFTAHERTVVWQQAAFANALDSEDRSILLLAGSWLEYDILTTALYALTDGYDVYVILDAAPARSPEGAGLSRDRLLQFGATPVLSSQVIHEWCIETIEIPKRSALAKVLATCSH
jgi:hypothetical protein